MAMFIKKLAEKASKMYNHGNIECHINGLRAEDVRPRLDFHFGVPPHATCLAYDPLHDILAISTRNGQIKLFGMDNTQALLEPNEASPSKFMQFIENQGILLRVTTQNHIEAWNIDKKQLSHVYNFGEEISSFSVVQQSSYMYVGDCNGDVAVLKFDEALKFLVETQYRIPFSESHGISTEGGNKTDVVFLSAQPLAEGKRVLIIFKDGLISLWGVQESRTVYTAGGNNVSAHQESKTVTSASWACNSGSKVAVGYSSGDIFLWSVPIISDKHDDEASIRKALCPQSVPLVKLNLGYKMDKTPVVSLKWYGSDARTSRLYTYGFLSTGPSSSFQVILLNDDSESRIIKLALPLSEPCLTMEVISCISNQSKNRKNALLLLLKSGRLCLYDDSDIEHYLLQCQSKSSPAPPKNLMIKLPFGDSSITVARFYTSNPASASLSDEEHISLDNKYSCLFSMNMSEKNANHPASTRLSEFSKMKNLLVTGHSDGTINFWDASCPLLFLALTVQQQQPKESDSPPTSPVTSLLFDISAQILVSGHRDGLVRIIKFKKEQNLSETVFSFLQAKQGENYTVQHVKLQGAIKYISTDPESKLLAVGTERGYVSLIQMEGITVLYQTQIPGHVNSAIISLQFEAYVQNGLEKRILLVGREDCSVLALEDTSGNAISDAPIQPKKPSRALLMHILDASPEGTSTSGSLNTSTEYSMNDTTQKQSLLVLCSENAVRLFFLTYVIQGVKKVYGKKKLNGSCCHASIIYGSSSEVGLILVFTCGRIEIRSLPDLDLLGELTVRDFAYSTQELPSAAQPICASSGGGVVLVNGDQAIIFLSILSSESYRNLKQISLVYKKDVIGSKEVVPNVKSQKEKKKGLLSMVVKDLKGNKTNNTEENYFNGSNANISEELSSIFSVACSLPSDETRKSIEKSDEDMELDIDDIDLEDAEEKHKGINFAGFSKQKLGKKFNALKDKLKAKQDEKASSPKKRHEEEKSPSAVDQIKQKYGYGTNDASSVSKVAANNVQNLSENIKKLQDIEKRTSEMQDNAQTFSSLANELLETTQNRNRIL